ncbi:MarR family winged helix-turn-helix transcriptional regulator [Metaclostridioides mangenotii]|uniref:MarR family winged helix-turn-helix transcriptional regulator n=1 Tax=Metaclostridioides mangenotii TaxID=1540 RepID=UPI0004879410|nr:MarR family winged helix-turn-helix transcriptional regulator [Clostridioides mangenotii]
MESIGKLNAAIYRNMDSIVNSKLKDLPIRSGQQDFFYVVSINEGITQKELSEHLYIGKSTTAKAIKNLVDSGYIRKEKDEKDKRSDRLYLTEKGREISPRIQQGFIEVVNVAMKDLSDEEIETSIKLLNKILNNVYKEKIKINTNIDEL